NPVSQYLHRAVERDGLEGSGQPLTRSPAGSPRTVPPPAIPAGEPVSCGNLSLARGGSSAGQSSGLIICRSWVRAPPAPPLLTWPFVRARDRFRRLLAPDASEMLAASLAPSGTDERGT